MTHALLFLLTLAPGGCLEVATPSVQAADLAAAWSAFAQLPPEQQILPAPRPGVRRQLSPAEVARIAARFGLSGTPPSGICLERASRTLNPDDLLSALRAAWTAAGGSTGARITLEDFSQLRVPEGALEFGPPPARAATACRAGQPFSWRGRLLYDRNQSLPVWAIVRIEAPQPFLVFRRSLPAGAVLRPEDLEQQIIPCGLPGAQEPAAPEAAAGRRLRAAVRAGEPVRSVLLAPVREVDRGDTVAVRLEGLEHVSIRAIALSGGRYGERIILANPLNGARFQASVSGPGQALIAKESAHEPRH